MTQDSLEDKKLKQFGQTMAIAFFLFGGFFYWKGFSISIYLLIIGVMFQGMTWFYPKVLAPIQDRWMKFAYALGWFNTGVLLTLIFYLAFVPIRVILSLLRKDLLDQKIEKKKASYWQVRSQGQAKQSDYERLF